MPRLITFRGVFGQWMWEWLDDSGGLLAESRYGFDSQKECMDDARAHGVVPETAAAARPAGEERRC